MLLILISVIFGFIFGIYFLYSLICWFYAKKGISHNKDSIYPSVTLLICAFNEADVILKKIENIIRIDYPKENLNILFVNDNSTDDTGTIIQENLSRIPFQADLINNALSRGKINALNYVFPKLNKDVTILTDADSLFESNSIKELVKNFYDSKVGGVSGVVRILSQEKTGTSVEHENLYRRFFDLWRKGESVVHSITISNGPIMAVRTSILKKQILDSLADDTELLFIVIKSGHRFVYEPDAVAYECTPSEIQERFSQKMRRAKGVFQVYVRNFNLMGKGRFGSVVFPFVFLQICVIPYVFILGSVFYFWLAVTEPVWFLALGFFFIPKIRSILNNIIFSQIQLAFSPFYKTGAWKTMKSSRKTLSQVDIEKLK